MSFSMKRSIVVISRVKQPYKPYASFLLRVCGHRQATPVGRDSNVLIPNLCGRVKLRPPLEFIPRALLPPRSRGALWLHVVDPDKLSQSNYAQAPGAANQLTSPNVRTYKFLPLDPPPTVCHTKLGPRRRIDLT